ncbi:hypothetical protein NGM37_56780, partial [Streptomyces sp. TRM76130]|nr:hypothetical protein [Streptomyces sp. TRM76130]
MRVQLAGWDFLSRPRAVLFRVGRLLVMRVMSDQSRWASGYCGDVRDAARCGGRSITHQGASRHVSGRTGSGGAGAPVSLLGLLGSLGLLGLRRAGRPCRLNGSGPR